MAKKEMSLKKSLIIHGSAWTLAGIWAISAHMGAFSDEGLDSDAAQAVKREYNNLSLKEVGGFGWFDCGRDGFFSTRFTATDTDGREVQGTVCESLSGAKLIKFR